MKSNNRDKIKPKKVPEGKENNKQERVIKETNIRGDKQKRKEVTNSFQN